MAASTSASTSEGFRWPSASWIMISTLVYSRSTSRCNAASSGRSAKHRVEAATNTVRFLPGQGSGGCHGRSQWHPKPLSLPRGGPGRQHQRWPSRCRGAPRGIAWRRRPDRMGLSPHCREKGDRVPSGCLLPERPFGGHHACMVVAQKVPVPFFPSPPACFFAKELP